VLAAVGSLGIGCLLAAPEAGTRGCGPWNRERWQSGGTRRRVGRVCVSLQGVFGHTWWDRGQALLRGLHALVKQMMLFEYVATCEGPKL